MNYTELEGRLASIHDVGPEGWGAFRARLRVLRDKGVPHVPRVGKGARVEYTFEDLWESNLALRLQEAGLPPSRVVEIVTNARKFLPTLPEMERRGDAWLTVLTIVVHGYGQDLDSGKINVLVDSFDIATRRIRDHIQGRAIFFLFANLSKMTRECKGILD
jgi:hypothetical protein